MRSFSLVARLANHTAVDVSFDAVCPLNFTQFQFLPRCDQNPCLDFSSSFKEKENKFWKHIDYRSLNYCLFRETSTTPAQTVAEANSHEEKPVQS